MSGEMLKRISSLRKHLDRMTPEALAAEVNKVPQDVAAAYTPLERAILGEHMTTFDPAKAQEASDGISAARFVEISNAWFAERDHLAAEVERLQTALYDARKDERNGWFAWQAERDRLAAECEKLRAAAGWPGDTAHQVAKLADEIMRLNMRGMRDVGAVEVAIDLLHELRLARDVVEAARRLLHDDADDMGFELDQRVKAYDAHVGENDGQA